MPFVQINPPGMSSTAPGYISSITVRTGGVDEELLPHPVTGEIVVDELAATKLVQDWAKFKYVAGGYPEGG
jgi:hypothetical protein